MSTVTKRYVDGKLVGNKVVTEHADGSKTVTIQEKHGPAQVIKKETTHYPDGTKSTKNW